MTLDDPHVSSPLLLPITPSIMRHILLPTDFSENSFHAAQYAAQVFGAQGVAYTLVHTYLDADPTISSWTGMADELYKAAVDGMQEWDARVRQLAGMKDAQIQTEVIHGPLVALMNEMGKRTGADLVVMGTLGRTGAGILGSNAVSMVKHGHLPVIVVPGKARLQELRRILFADDQQGVEPGDLAVLLELARRWKAEVVLAHVLRTGDEEPDEELIADFDGFFKEIPHRFTAAQGRDIAAAIDLLGEREEADMIAVLHRHVGFFEGLFHTSTSKRLALHTDVPLLVLRDRHTSGMA